MPNDTALCADLFHTATGTAFADIMIAGHRETWPIRSKRFRAWLRRRNYEATAAAPSAAAMRSVLDLLEARAQFDAPERAVSIRVAEHAGHLYLDLPDEFWRAVDISPGGWRVIACPPVRFRRPAGMLPLPLPERGGSIEAPASMLNLSSQNDLVLLVAWLLATLRSAGPYPLLVVSGEQGSAKTVLSKLLRALVDPNAAAVRALPREERELMIAANNGHLLAFDNLSNLPAGLSDALCRLASGGSFAVRRLYSDDEEVLFQAPRPILLNGIEADRAVCQNRSNVSSSAAVASSGKYSSARAQAARATGTGALIGPKLRSSLKLRTSSSRLSCRSARRSVPAALSPNTIWSMGFRMPKTFTRSPALMLSIRVVEPIRLPVIASYHSVASEDAPEKEYRLWASFDSMTRRGKFFLVCPK